MFVELIDLLRCPNAHADSWLVASALATAERHVVRGALGCPVCHAEFAVRDAVVEFGDAPDAALAPDAIDDDDVMRVAALLGLTTPGGTVVLGGAWQQVAAPLADLTGVRVLLLDPVRPEPLRAEVSAIRSGGAIPVAAGALRGVALDAHTADAPRLAAAVRALGAGARLVAPATVHVPDGVAELARDERHWVAEVRRPTVTLSRASRQSSA